MPRRRAVLCVLAACGVAAYGPKVAWAACEIFPRDGRRDFLILRHGQAVGHHRITYTRQPAEQDLGALFIVRSDVEIRAGLTGTHIFRLQHHAEEVWRDGWLDQLTADTDDDGRRYQVRAARRGGIFAGAVNGAAFTVSGYIVPASLWHHDMIASETLFDALDGRMKRVQAHLIGEEEVPLRGRKVPTRHYALEGQIKRQLWYDADCRLARAAFLARDGSWLTLEEA